MGGGFWGRTKDEGQMGEETEADGSGGVSSLERGARSAESESDSGGAVGVDVGDGADSGVNGVAED